MRTVMRNGSGQGGAGVVAVLALALLSGCATRRRAAEPALSASVELARPSGQFLIEYDPADARDAARVQQAVEQALPRLARWGALRETVSIKVMPDHESLENAVQQRGMGWLRAWGRYDDVFVQAPSTWGVAGATQPQINELLLHELTHSLMYQLASDRLGWSRKQIPLWFREGMASYTAEQSYRWVSLEEIARHFERVPDSDPVRSPGELYRDDSNFIYGVAHHAFSFLVRRYGEDAVRALLGEMYEGKSFPEAFQSAIGVPPDTFVSDFTRYVRWRGFRSGRTLPRANEPR
ncbi:peptidase MA family metallohydrolase [Archangium sp.]|uniref:peptidase MA family metallohydrolase n=1 Tax=Archangium sp. TaxID=1872627 RepID=UPI002ED98CB8